MIVYVVTGECGLNGHWVEGVFSTRVEAEYHARRIDRRTTTHSITGYGGMEVAEAVIDGEVREP
jgi:hypothetical protein